HSSRFHPMSATTVNPLPRPAYYNKGNLNNVKPVGSHPSPSKKQFASVQILKRPADLPKNQAPADLKKLIPKAKSSSFSKPAPSPSATGNVCLSEPASTPKPKTSAGRRPRGKQRRNSVNTTAHPPSSHPNPSQVKGGHLSDSSVPGVACSKKSSSKSCRPYSSNRTSATRVASSISKEQAAELLLQSLLQKDESASFPVQEAKVDLNDLSMASHLLLNLLKPTKLSSTRPSGSKSFRYYAGPMFSKAPEPSTLPLPSFLAN
ncbi:hypothetical protein L0F63_004657, partial [Massospora cicadina]